MIASPTLDGGNAAPQAARPAPLAPPTKTRRVVDAPMRMFHALFALTFAGAFLTAESEHWRLLHVTLGYTFGALLGFRVLYGLVGPRQARLTQLWRRLTGAPAWIVSMATAARAGTVMPWRQGQNLAMALVLVALLALPLPLVLSGWGTFNDVGEVFEDLHEALASGLLTLVLTHLGLIASLSLLRQQNAAAPMLTGRMPGAGPNLVQHNRGWLAGLLMVATLAFGAWLWRDAVTATDGTAPSTASWMSNGDTGPAGRGRDDRDDDD